MTENSSLCNEGSPPYFENFLILPKSIKVSMKKKRKKKRKRIGGEGSPPYILRCHGSVHCCKSPTECEKSERPVDASW